MAKKPASFSIDEEVKKWVDNADINKSKIVNEYLKEEMQKRKYGERVVLEKKKTELKTEIKEKEQQLQQLKKDLENVEQQLENVSDPTEETVEQMLELAEDLLTVDNPYREQKYEPIGILSKNDVKKIFETVDLRYAQVIDDNEIEKFEKTDELRDELERRELKDEERGYGYKQTEELVEVVTSLTDKEEEQIRTEVENRLG